MGELWRKAAMKMRARTAAPWQSRERRIVKAANSPLAVLAAHLEQ
jgi:hypothetical protein